MSKEKNIAGRVSAAIALAMGVFVSIASIAFAESSLPKCPSNTKILWTNCQGSYKFPDGTRYVGEWQGDKPNGYGTVTWPDGRIYVGEFQDGSMSGQGTKTWPSGVKYVGEFRDSEINGKGTKTWPDGTRKFGTWANGELVTEEAISSFPSINNLPRNFTELQSKATGYLSDSNFQIFFGLLFAGAFVAGAVHIFRNAKPVTSSSTSLVGTTNNIASESSKLLHETVMPAEVNPSFKVAQSIDLTQALERLTQLREKGILTEAEFEQEKQRIFNS